MAREESLAPRIVLVRHAKPVVDPQCPAHDWGLVEGAEENLLSLVARLRPLDVDGIITSPERKAAATARIIAIELGLGVVEEPALREQGGEYVPWIGTKHGFRAAVGGHFARPEEAMLGNESSTEAVERFITAIERARARYHLPLLVTHGRVMSGFLARVLDTYAVSVWKELRMLDALVVDLLRRTCLRVGAKEA